MKTQDIKNMGQALQQVQESSKAALAKKLAKASQSSEKGKAAVTLPKAPFEIPKKDANEALKGDQHKLDHDKDGDIDAADFKGLRNKKKKGEKAEVKPRQETETDKAKDAPMEKTEGKVDEISMDKARATFQARQKLKNRAGLAGDTATAQKHQDKARKTQDIIRKRNMANEATMDTAAGRKQAAADADAHHKAMVKKHGADHPATKDAAAAAKAMKAKANESTKWPVYARIMEKKSHTAGATPPEEMDSKDSPTAKKMKADHKPEVNDTEEKGHQDAADAGRKGPNGQARPNDRKEGDKKVVNPVKGAQ